MKNKVLLMAAAMLVSVALADTADAGIFRNRCGAKRTPVRNVVKGTRCVLQRSANVVGGVLHFSARVVTAPVRAVRGRRCCDGSVRCCDGSVATPTAVNTNNKAPKLETAPSPPQ